MKIFVQDEDEVPPPVPMNDAPANTSNTGYAALGLNLSQAEAAAARLQQMILDESQASPPEQTLQAREMPHAPAVPEPEPASPPPPPPPVPAASPYPEPVESLSHEEYQAIHEALRSIADRIPAIPDTGGNGQQLLTRIGPGGLNFVEQAMRVAEQQSGILPRSFDLEGFRHEARFLRDLGALGEELRALSEHVAAAEARLGSEAFTRALGVYQAAKLSGTAGEWGGFQS